MKRGTENLLKFKHLMRDLDLTESFTLGVLQNLWLKTDINAPRGNIGKFSDEDIAVMIDWRGDPEGLINALVAREWLDEDPEHRLVVHDWPEHCEDTTHGKVARNLEYFADGSPPRLVNLGRRYADVTAFFGTEQESLSETSSVTTSSQQNTPPVVCSDTDTDTDTYTYTDTDTEGRSSVVSQSGSVSEPGPDAIRLERVLRVTREPPEYEDWWRDVSKRLRAAGEFGTLVKALEHVERSPEIKKPGAYLCSRCRDALKKYGISMPPKPKPKT